MQQPERLESVDYLVVGHITIDKSPQGPRLGGTAAYAALTAKALGWRPGILTAWAEELPLGPLADIPIVNLGAEQSSTFQNFYSKEDRRQQYSGQASFLEFHHIPESWRSPRLLHLAPVAREVSPRISNYFEDSFVGVTPQGWLREWGANGNVLFAPWEEGELVLAQTDAAVMAQEDVHRDSAQIERLAAACPLLIVTDGQAGARLYQQGQEHVIEAPQAHSVDPTGAGDIFAAVFFIHFYQSGEPLQAAHVASRIAANSVERHGLDGVPTTEEIYDLIAEAI